MIPLIRKDLLLLCNLNTLFPIVIYGLVIGKMIDMAYPVVMLMVFSFITVLIGCEEKHTGQTLANSLPVNKKEIIASKYVEGLIFAIVGYLLVVVLQIPLRLFLGENPFPFSFAYMPMIIAAVLLVLAVFYPLYFELGKGISLTTVWLVVFILYMIPILGTQAILDDSGVGLGYWGVVVFICVLPLYYVSFLLSFRSYKGKDILD